jgi:hypothetical protein
VIMLLLGAAAGRVWAQLNIPWDQVQERLKTMSPEEQAKIQRLLADGLLILELQSGKCARADEVKAKAAQSDAQSIYLLSDMYRNGWCVEKDIRLFQLNLARLRLRPTRCIRIPNSCGFPVDVSGLRSSLPGTCPVYGA